MRVGIDYTAAVRQGGGIGRYTRSLVRALSELDSHHHFTLLLAAGSMGEATHEEWPANFRVRAVPLSDRWMHILWQRLRLPVPVQAITGPLNLFHSPDFVLPPTGRAPTVVTVHDLSFCRVPQFFVPGFCRYLNGAVGRAVRRAGHILADSECTKRDLLELMGVEEARVTVVYPGVEARFKPVHDRDVLQRVRQRYDLPERFVLALGTLQPRKNLNGLITSFARIVREAPHAGELEGLHLVVGGAAGWMYEDSLERVGSEGLAEQVRFIGFVHDDDLPGLYSLSEAFAFPSWYEGFGLPVLEAMACGTPVIAADNSSLPEVVGEGGLLVNVAERDSLTEGLHRVLTDEALRRQLVAAGARQARRFSWHSAATQVLSVYERLMDIG